MKIETQNVMIGEWLGDVPDDWDYNKFYDKYIARSATNGETLKKRHNNSVRLYKKMAKALKDGKEVYAINDGGFSHKVYYCELYDGWPFWEPRPCYAYEGPIPGVHIGEYYNLTAVEIIDK